MSVVEAAEMFKLGWVHCSEGEQPQHEKNEDYMSGYGQRYEYEQRLTHYMEKLEERINGNRAQA